MLYILIFIFGLTIGSFLNVIICRLETKKSIFFARSHCPKCGAILKWYDLIPIISFLIQKNRCRYCKKKISWQYPMVEIITGLLFLLIFFFNFAQDKNFHFINLSYYLIIVCFLIIIFVYDLRHYIIPDKIVFPGIIIALIYNFLNYGLLNTDYRLLLINLLSAFLASGFFLSLVLISKGKWMSLGDVKLVFLMGIILGWPSISFALLLSFFSGAIIGISLILFGKKGLKSQIPFGPFLSGATILVILLGSRLFYWFEALLYF